MAAEAHHSRITIDRNELAARDCENRSSSDPQRFVDVRTDPAMHAMQNHWPPVWPSTRYR
jgi:hypothetical protein